MSFQSFSACEAGFIEGLVKGSRNLCVYTSSLETVVLLLLFPLTTVNCCQCYHKLILFNPVFRIDSICVVCEKEPSCF